MTADQQSAEGRTMAEGFHYFEDVEAGDRFTTPSVTITAAQIDAFADLSGDRFEIHMDDEAARALGFERRVAHGLLILSLVDGLKNQAATRFHAVASLGWDWSFKTPVLIGDTISVEIRVIEKRLARHGRRGIATLAFTVYNQRGAIVQAGTNQLMVLCRP